jgi:DNA-binding CsgD family transcriptional regulator
VTGRPIERRVLRLVAEGTDDAEIARRFKRSPEMIGRLVVMARLPRPQPRRPAPSAGSLRPLERRVLRWRDLGADHAAIGARFKRSPEHIGRVERFARDKRDKLADQA